jgi:hypothetical protein
MWCKYKPVEPEKLEVLGLGLLSDEVVHTQDVDVFCEVYWSLLRLWRGALLDGGEYPVDRDIFEDLDSLAGGVSLGWIGETCLSPWRDAALRGGLRSMVECYVAGVPVEDILGRSSF